MDSTARPARARLSEAAAIERLVADAGRAGLFFDFDGTLAPIQLDPDAVWPTPGVAEALSALACQVSRIAVVSARPVPFLRHRLEQVEGLLLYGHYGIQTMATDGTVVTESEALPWIPVLSELARQARAQLPSDVVVEHQLLSVSLHYRAAPHRRAVVEEWARAQATAAGVSVQPGRMVVEIKPPLERDKGSVLTSETTDLLTAWYVGDDIADMRAFQALGMREAQTPGFVGVRVAVANKETGKALQDAADFVIGATTAVPEFLRRLSRALAGGSAITSERSAPTTGP